MKISKPASRICALLLAVFMLFGMLPVSAFAEGETTTYNLVTEVDGIESGKDYVIVVGDKYALTNEEGPQVGSTQGSNAYKGLKSGEVQISNTQIVSGVTSNMIWTVSVADGKLTITDAEGKFLTANYGGTGHGNTRKLLVDTTVDGNWEYSTKSNKNVLNNTSQNTTQTGNDNGCYLYLLDDNEYHSIGVKSQGSNYKNAAVVTFYEVVKTGSNPPATVNPEYTAPSAATLTYNGQPQALVTGGSVDAGQGTMLYKLGNGEYSATVPSATDAGTYSVSWMVEGADGYNDVVAEQPISVTIAAKAVEPTVTVDPASVAYDGTAKQPTTVTVKDGETVIPASEYTVATTNNTNAGTATVTVTDKNGGNYAFTTATGTFTITAKAVTPTVTLSQESYTYDGTEKKPTVTVKVGESLIPETEYEVTYADNINAGTAKVTVTDNANGNYTFDPVEKSFTITAHSHNWTYTASGATITATCSGAGTCVNAEKKQTITVVAPTDLVYSGTAKVATITGAIDGVTTPAIVYSAAECKNVGEYTASITLGEGAAAKTATASFTITAKSVTPTVTLSQDSYVYDGTAKQPTVTVKDGETTIPAAEYTVTYSNNTNAGTATVTVTDNANGNYAFTPAVTANFTITTPAAGQTVTYTQIDADEIAAGDKIVIVANYQNAYYALANDDDKKATVTVPNGVLTIPAADADNIVWTVKAGQTAGETADDENWDVFVFQNGTKYFGRRSTYNDIQFTTDDATNFPLSTDDQKKTARRFGHAAYEDTIGNFNNEDIFYGLLYGVNSTNSSTTEFHYLRSFEADDSNVTFYKVTTSGSPVTPPATHTHNWSYAASGATITATCNGAGTCNATNKSITVVAPTELTYNGSAKVATITGAIDGVTNPTITYTPAGNPVNAGNYTASITLGSATASVSFTIAKAASALTTTPAAKTDLIANGSEQELITAGQATGGQIQYKVDSGAYGTAIPKAANAGTYTVYYKVVGDANHNDIAETSFSVTIAQAAQPPVDDDDEFVKQDPTVSGEYVIVINNQYALTNVAGTETPSSSSANGYVGLKSESVTITDNKIASNVASNMVWTVTVANGKLTIQDASGKYLTADYGGSNYGNTRKLLLGTTADGNWAYSTQNGKTVLNNTAQNTSQDGNNAGCYLHLTNTADHTISVRSQGSNFGNAATVTFYKVGDGTVTPPATTKTLDRIAVTTQPTKTAYTAGENFDTAGMAVTATYSDNSSNVVTGWTVTDGNSLTAGKTSVTISYTEGGVTKTATVAITVTAATQPPVEDEEPTYTKINASDIKIGDKIVIVGVSGNNHYALTNGSTQTTAVTVSNNQLTISGSPNALVWTVGEATGNQVDTANGNDLDYVFSNGSTYFGRVTETNVVEFATGTAANTKYFGHDVQDGTIGNFSRSTTPPYYGLLFQNNQFIYVNGADNTSNASVLFFRAYNVAGGEGGGNEGGNEGGGNEGGGNVTNPAGTVFAAFSSDAHSFTSSTTSGSPARLNNWLNNVSSAIGGTFTSMAIHGDFARGDGQATGDTYWSYANAVMTVAENRNKVGETIFINGNHEWKDGYYDTTDNAVADKITGIGVAKDYGNYVIYTFGAAGSSQAFQPAHITALGNWLQTAPTNKPIFIISHYPIHKAGDRETTNAGQLLDTLNANAATHDIYFIWGHNHTNANSGETNYDKVITDKIGNDAIKFTYLAAGCMSDSENNGGSAAVKGKGLVAKIVDGKVATLTYYGENANVVYTHTVNNTPSNPNPDQPGTPDQPNIPEDPGKVDTIENGDYVIVVNNQYALTNVTGTETSSSDSSNGYIGLKSDSVTISNNKITSDVAANMIWTVSVQNGKLTIKDASGKFLTADYGGSGYGNTRKLLVGTTADGNWEYANNRLNNTAQNTSQTNENSGCYLYLTNTADHTVSVRSQGTDFVNPANITFYKVEIVDEPEQPEQPEQPAKSLLSIAVTTQPTKTAYTAGDDFDSTGMVVTATYSDNSKAVVTGWTVSNGTDLAEGVTGLTVSYTEGEVTKTTTVAITVEAAELFDFVGANMQLGNNLSMNFFIAPENLDENEDYYAVITMDYADDREDYEAIIEEDEWSWYTDGKLHYVTMDMVAAKEMTDEITVTIYNDEDEQVSVEWVDSVRDYAMRVLDEETDKTKAALYVEMLNYGAAAQEYFDYDESDLANNQLTAEQKAYGVGDMTLNSKVADGTGYVGMNLQLESSILVNFFFNTIPEDHDDMYAVVTFVDHYGDRQTVTVEGEGFGLYSGYWYVSVNNLVVADCSEEVTVKIYDGNNEEIADAVDSMENYIGRARDEDPLYEAIMRFAVSARVYLHSI